jgi:ABC-type lipoprotein release transport system permease subunit
VQFRRLHVRVAKGTGTPAGLQVVGRFDPRRLPEFSPLSRVPLETYFPPRLDPADAAAKRALHGRPYLPTQNLGDYVAQPPLVLAPLSQVNRFFLDPDFFAYVSPRVRRAPISVIRVRVKGVEGPDPVSRARVRVVAQKIHDRTGLDVDITAGSSPHPLLISLPKGKFGRPPLLLREAWSKKGVSVVFLRAVDRKSLGLFALVLVVCCFFLANGAFAAARARRTEVGILRTLGWSQTAIFRALIGELALIGLVAGAVGTALAAGLVEAFELDLPLTHTLAVLPLSVALACVAGVVPTWRAARISPLEAVRPRIAGGAPTHRVGQIVRFALVNLRRLPARTAVSAAGLVIGIAALTLLLAIQRAFQGTLVGTLLGKAIALQVRGVDLTAAALTIVLAAVSVADVLYLNLRERASELVTLRTTGWSDRHLARLVALEALALGLAGSLAGAVLGVALGTLFLDVPLGSLALAALLAAAGGTVTAFGASLLPLSQIRRLTPPSVLASE